MHYPPISCFTSTFGRIACLNELVRCFLDQNYPGEKELVILNDYEHQTICYDHEQIKIFNVKDRIKPLGKKFNTNIALCKHDIIAVFEDDDLFLPNHLTYAIENMKNGIFHSCRAWVMYGDKPVYRCRNLFHSSHVFERKLFDSVGGYEETDACTVDVSIIKKFQKLLGVYSQEPSENDTNYVYRWLNNHYHGSGWGVQISDISDKAMYNIEIMRSQKRIPTGTIELNPNYAKNYHDLIEQAKNGTPTTT